jgi:hypothetical protein
MRCKVTLGEIILEGEGRKEDLNKISSTLEKVIFEVERPLPSFHNDYHNMMLLGFLTCSLVLFALVFCSDPYVYAV